MGKLAESWCFCKGVGKSEKMKAAIFSSRSAAVVRISTSSENGSHLKTGILIHRNLVLTSHANIPSVTASESSVITFQDGTPATLCPHRFFITSSVLDLTIVGVDTAEGDHLHQRHYLKTTAKPNLDLGTVVYFLGFAEKEEIAVGEGKVVISTDNLIKLSNDGVSWSPGSAGFDSQGNLAFMICDPMKIATSPTAKSSSTSSTSSSDSLMQFGIPVSVICDWLNQHWEGSLDEASKPRLPIMKLMSKNEHSSASFTIKQVFKSSDEAAPEITTHTQGIPPPEIYESSKLTAYPVQRKENNPSYQLLDINFPPRLNLSNSGRIPSCANEIRSSSPNSTSNCAVDNLEKMEGSSTGSVNAVSVRIRDEYSSEEETMYSAETAESRNYTIPREDKVGRSQSCVIHNRWNSYARNPIARRSVMEQQRGSRVYSHGATSQRSNDYFSPTVSSIMKKRNSLEQPIRPKQSVVQSSPRWMV